MNGVTTPQAAAGAPQRPRVLLVDDDPLMRRMVALVLEVIDLELIVCASVAQARETLRQAPVQLLITDLMMPVESGEVLLSELQADPALRAGARLVVFSAGLDARARARLQALGVWRLLDKPIGVQALEDCVREALGLQAAPGGLVDTALAPGAAGRARDLPLSAAETAAVQRHFAGSADLFFNYRETCRQQFADDLGVGDQALQAGDGPALRRLAHNLKSVLRMLGAEAAAAHADALEGAALRADWPAAGTGWQAVRAAIQYPGGPPQRESK